MVKISRPIVYTLVLGTAAYAVVLLTEPEPPARKSAPRSRQRAVRNADGITEADRSARFPRYTGGSRNAFAPVVVPAKPSRLAALGNDLPQGIAAPGTDGVWSLTGVNIVNGVHNALIENPATQESQFLRVGDRWNGLRVAAIQEDGMIFLNALGQETRLTFAQPAAEPVPGGPGSAVPPGPGPGGVPRLPSVTAGRAFVAETPRTSREREAN
ncbi:MAG: hypothetical protein IT210_20545 [Armatimonadetes bacterium]|nr:hypothetical protein [Armatimonadota bacterium]